MGNQSLEVYGRGNEHSRQSKPLNLPALLVALKDRLVHTVPAELLGTEPSVTSDTYEWRVFRPTGPETYTLHLKSELMTTFDDGSHFSFYNPRPYSFSRYEETRVSVHREPENRIGIRILGGHETWNGYQDYVKQKFVLPQTGRISDGIVIFEHPGTRGQLYDPARMAILHLQPSQYRGKILVTPVSLDEGGYDPDSFVDPIDPEGDPLDNPVLSLPASKGPFLLPPGRFNLTDFTRTHQSVPVER